MTHRWAGVNDCRRFGRFFRSGWQSVLLWPIGDCDYDYTCADPINATDLDGKPLLVMYGSEFRALGPAPQWDIALTAASFIPGVGQAVWAYRGYRTYRLARASCKSSRAGRSLRRIRSGYRCTGPVHAWSLRYDRKPHPSGSKRLKPSHLQFDKWRVGVEGSHRSWHFPLPWPRPPVVCCDDD